MAQGQSIHIGLNNVDPNQYSGWNGQLAGCINDANAMKKIADGAGFTSQILTNEQATFANVVQAISNAAKTLDSGDMLLISYSGHGGQVPDANAMPGDDGLDETWVLYDKMILDDQLNVLWSQFKSGVRIFVLSDSCHSGTILREMVLTQIRKALKSGPVRDRAIPRDIQAKHYARLKDDYTASQYLTGDERTIVVKASVLLISGCQDNQTSQDGDQNGLFTENLLAVWQDGAFTGSYKQFHQAILDKMPPQQTPNYFKVGVDNSDFEAQQPFTIDASASSSSLGSSSPGTPASSSNPKVTGPATIDRDTAGAPTFNVDLAGAPYYIFEITSEPSLFSNRDARSDSNFYGSYNDSGVPSRLTTATFTLPDTAWQSLKAADTLYYRIGTTTSQTGWDNYTASTPDDQATNAPSISVTGAKSAEQPAAYSAGTGRAMAAKA
jgi:metacaspase-1